MEEEGLLGDSCDETITLSPKLKRKIILQAKWRALLFILGLRTNYSIEDLLYGE